MRNLKKILAVVLAVAMLASMSVTALAAGANEAQAADLKSIGLFKGVSDTDFNLEGNLPRIQAMILTIRAMGIKDETVNAMSQEEIDEQLAKVADGASIAAWQKPFAAYALKLGITTGVGRDGAIYFDAEAPITGTLFVTLLLRAMGYNPDYTNPWATAVEAGLSSAISLGFKTSLIRDDAAGLIYAMVKDGKNANGKTFIQALIDAGAVDAEAAAAAGFIAQPEPEGLKVVSVKALNLKQFVVVFNKAVDEDTATDIDNYALDTDGTANLTGATIDFGSDSKSVTINLHRSRIADFEEEVTLTVSGILDEDENEMDEQEIEFVFNDVTFPTVVDAKVVGNDTIKVIFSEPIAVYDLEGDDFEVDGGDYLIRAATIMNNDTEINVELYSDLEEGEIELKINNTLEDYAGYNVQKKTMTLEVVEDNDPPVIVGYKDADNDQVTLIFDGDIEIADPDPENFYHTSIKNPAGNGDSDFTAGEDYDLDGNELTLYFIENPLPNGTAYITIAKKAINDLWDNENDKLTYKIEIVEDTDAPYVKKIEVEAEDQIVITFNEVLDPDSFDEDSFTLLDEDGKVLDLIRNARLDGTGKKIIIDFKDDLNGDYSIVIDEVEDTAGNEVAKTTKDFTVNDKTAPDATDFKATLYKAGQKGQMIKVEFGEKMATSGKYSVLDPEKYVISSNGRLIDLADPDPDADVKIVAVDGGKAVEIYLDSTVDDAHDGIDIYHAGTVTRNNGTPADPSDDYLVYDAGDGRTYLEIGRVADAAGNYTTSNSWTLDLRVPSVVTYDAEATAPDTIVITFDGTLKTFDKTEFEIYVDVQDDDSFDSTGDTKITPAKLKTSVNKDGDYVATLTLAEVNELTYDALSGTHKVYIYSTVLNSKNAYGELVESTGVEVVDKIAPALAEITDDDGDDVDSVVAPVTTGTSIVLTFEEYIDQASVSLSTFLVGDGDYEVVAVTFSSTISAGGKAGAKVITLTIENDDNDDLVGVNIDQVSAIRDLAGNKTTGIKTEVAEIR